MYARLAAERLSNQCLVHRRRRTASALVEWFGVVQAQEYGPAKWGLGQRLPDGVTNARIERALTAGFILRTHVLRPTWHFVASADIRWMLELTAPRIHRGMTSPRRDLDLDPKRLARATAIVERVLENRALTRADLRQELARRGITASGAQMSHVCMYAELEGVICSGPRQDKHATYALLSERAPQSRRLSRDEAVAELVKRYFRSHGPATIADFVWWSGLTMSDARRGLEINRARREGIGERDYWTIGARRAPPSPGRSAHLLPIYDEYLVAYRDRIAVPHVAAVRSAGGEPVTFQHAIVIDGQVAGTWRLTRSKSGTAVSLFPVRSLTRGESRRITQQVERYGRFWNNGARPVDS